MIKVDRDKPFLVKESKGVNIFLGLLCLTLFVSSFFNNDESEKGFRLQLLHVAIIPAILFLRKGFANKTIISIDRKGIMYHGELITTWEDFIDARIEQAEVVLTIQDNFVLFVRYRQPGNRIFQSRIPLRNTHNKAEEEIIEAIRVFSRAPR